MSGDILKKFSEKYYGNYRMKVLDNNDPSKLGRVKAWIYPMLVDDKLKASELPWVVPAMPLFDGAGTGIGSFIVPRVGTMLWGFFEAGDIYQPVYFAEATDGVKGLPTNHTLAYPDIKAWQTKNGFKVTLVDGPAVANVYLKIVHPKGHTITIDNNVVSIAAIGNLETTSTVDTTIEPDGNFTVTVEGNASISATGNVTIEGATVSINP